MANDACLKKEQFILVCIGACALELCANCACCNKCHWLLYSTCLRATELQFDNTSCIFIYHVHVWRCALIRIFNSVVLDNTQVWYLYYDFLVNVYMSECREGGKREREREMEREKRNRGRGGVWSKERR